MTFTLGSYTLPLESALIALLCLILVALCFFIMNLNNRLKKLLRGKNTQSIEESLLTIASNVQDLIEFRKGAEEYLTTVELRVRNSIQSVETIRFNAFKGTGGGGQQSFATAFLNENGNGIVISTLYSSDRMSIFGKPISKFSSQFELTGEEKTVIGSATEKLK